MRINILSITLILCLFLSACAWIVQNIESAEVIAKISARRIGSELQFKQPDIAKEAYKICEFVLKDVETGEPEALKYYIHELLQQHISDPILAADIINLTELIEIKPNIPLDEEQIRIIKAIAGGLMNGIELSGGYYGETDRDG